MLRLDRDWIREPDQIMRLFRTEGALRPVPLVQAGRSAAEAVLTITTGVMLARLAWLVVAPSEPSPLDRPPSFDVAGPATPTGEAVLHQSTPLANPFGGATVTPAAVEAATYTGMNLSLAGLRAASGDGVGSAIFNLADGRQVRVEPGGMIIDGVVLDEIAHDRVYLVLQGERQMVTLGGHPAGELAIIGRDATAKPALPAAVPLQMDNALPGLAETGLSPRSLLADISFRPESRDGAIAGYRLDPRGLGAFEAAGLQSGDLVLRVNGLSVEGLSPDQIFSQVAQSPEISLDVVRAGAIVRIRLNSDAGLTQ